MDSLIRWKRGDYIKLGQAVSRFNRLIKELEVDHEKYLPELRDYKELRDHITTRKELNNIINSLRRATEENLQTIKEYPSGEKVSAWEYKEINYAKRRAIKNLNYETMTIMTESQSIGMGSERLSEIRAISDSFERLDEATGASFKRIKERIFAVGRADYSMSKYKTFKENFYTALEGAQNFENYDKLKKELDKIKNPAKFYEYVKKSPFLMDIFLWYKNIDVNLYGGFEDNEEAFDSSLMFHLGIEL